MKLPSKATSYNESILSKFTIILNDLKENRSMQIFELYIRNRKHFKSQLEFINTLDCLYALNKITYGERKEIVKYVK